MSANKNDTEVNNDAGAGSDNDNSDSDDEDFVPNEGNEEAGSEELSDDDVNDDDDPDKTDKKKKTGKGQSRKRRAPSKKSSTRNGLLIIRSKRGRFEAADEEDDDLDADGDLDLDLQPPEEKEANEKAETDRLWADFKTSVDEARKSKTTTTTKIVEKIYDFAGEKVAVQERVTVSVSNNGNNKDDDSMMMSPPPAPTPRSLSTPTKKNGGDGGEPKPGPSSAVTTATTSTSNGNNGKVKPVIRRRGGISILGNDPEAIGLAELDKRGLSGLLKAFKQKSSGMKIGTLEKSKLDWETYKRQQGLEEELQSHTKSRDTFIDKQEFLQRTDHRQFENEKSMRATARSKRLANNSNN